METRALFLIIVMCSILILAAKLSPPLRKCPWWMGERSITSYSVTFTPSKVNAFCIYSAALNKEQMEARAAMIAL